MKLVERIWATAFVFGILCVVDSIKRNPNERSALFQAFQGHILKYHVLVTRHVSSAMACANECLQLNSCLSFNLKPKTNNGAVCELNSVPRVACAACYTSDVDATYYEHSESSIHQEIAHGNDDSSNYDLTFPEDSVSSYVTQTWSMDLNVFTICFWMRSSSSTSSTPFSYILPKGSIEITISRDALDIDLEEVSISLGTYYDGVWHHVCIKWKNTHGSWKVTVDGKDVNTGNGLNPGHVIKGGGIVVVGQVQDFKLGDALASNLSQNFVGNINGMHVWSRGLTKEEIVSMSSTCNMGNGNVLKWSDFDKSLHGDVLIEYPSSCK